MGPALADDALSLSDDALSLSDGPLCLPSDASFERLGFSRPPELYASPNNPGAKEAAEAIEKELKLNARTVGLNVTTTPPAMIRLGSSSPGFAA